MRKWQPDVAAKLTPDQCLRILELQSRCWTQARIAVELGIDRTAVGRTLARLNAQAMKDLAKRGAEIKAAQVAQLQWLAGEVAGEWERSKLDGETLDTTTTGELDDDGDPVPGKTKTRVKGQTGDPGLARELQAALASVRKILGLDAPVAVTPSDAAFNLSQLTEDAERAADEYRPDERPGREGSGPGPPATGGLPE